MFQVVKRDGEIAEFQMAKITSAIDKAFDAKEKNYSKDMIDLLALRVTADFQNKIQDGKVTVEDIHIRQSCGSYNRLHRQYTASSASSYSRVHAVYGKCLLHTHLRCR